MSRMRKKDIEAKSVDAKKCNELSEQEKDLQSQENHDAMRKLEQAISSPVDLALKKQFAAVFHNNDAPNICSAIKAWLETEFPRQFDRLHPLNFYNAEEAMQRNMKGFENTYSSFLKEKQKQIRSCNDSIDEILTKATQINSLLQTEESRANKLRNDAIELMFIFTTMRGAPFFKRCRLLYRLLFGKPAFGDRENEAYRL